MTFTQGKTVLGLLMFGCMFAEVGILTLVVDINAETGLMTSGIGVLLLGLAGGLYKRWRP